MGACLSNQPGSGRQEPDAKAEAPTTETTVSRGLGDISNTEQPVLVSAPKTQAEAKPAQERALPSVAAPSLTTATHSHSGRAELANSVEFWEQKGKKQVHHLSSQELTDHYGRDNLLLLAALDRMEQTVRATASQPSGRNSPALVLPPHAVNSLSKRSSSSSDGLSPATPTAEQGVHKSAASLDSSPPQQPAEGPTTSAASESSAASLSSILSRDLLIAGAADDYEGGRVLSARNKLQSWCQAHSTPLADLEPYSDAIHIDVKDLMQQCKRAEELLHILKDEKDFSVARDDGDLRVLYKLEKGRVHHIKMESTLPTPLERPLALAREFDLMSGWNPYVKDSSLLYAPTIWQSWVYAALWMPFPFPQIDTLATGRGYDLSEEDRSLLVTMESVAEAELPAGSQPIPAQAKRRKRATVVKGSSLRLEALPPGPDGSPRTRGAIMCIVDPHISHVPAFIVNFVLGVLTPFAHRQIRRLLQDGFRDPGQPFPRRMAAHPELYDQVRGIVKAGLARHYGIRAAKPRQEIEYED